ncbi:unnamed protein product [Ectocarpus sp. CCAP 1310/34]|nr:unnamed protein product [Ectocarpus sp. CCAP 1310/34]
MAGRRTGGTTPDGSQAADTKSSEQIDSMRSEISSLTQQMGQLVQLVGGLAARIEEKSGGATEGAAESGGAMESVATSNAGHFGTVQYDGAGSGPAKRVWSFGTTQRRSRGFRPPRGESSRCSQSSLF